MENRKFSFLKIIIIFLSITIVSVAFYFLCINSAKSQTVNKSSFLGSAIFALQEVISNFGKSESKFTEVANLDLENDKNIESNSATSSFKTNLNSEVTKKISISKANIVSNKKTLTTSSNLKDEISLCENIEGDKAAHLGMIINEIAWMGSKKSASDEWIELKNISKREINISGWQLINDDGKILITFGTNGAPEKIGSNKFLLLERTDDNSVPEIKADYIYSGSLGNSDESLRLFDEGCNLIDEVLANPDWLFGDNKEKITMERNPDFSWHNFSGVEKNGILGTPRAENSIALIKKEELIIDKKIDEEKILNSTSTIVKKEKIVKDNVSTGSGYIRPVFPKLLISEIQIAGVQNEKAEFVEIFNPNNENVSLNGWYIQKETKSATSFSTYTKTDLFNGKIIKAKEYFLISREDGGISSDIITNYSLADNNTIVLKDPNGDIVDKVGWGEAGDCETSCAPNHLKGESIERKLVNDVLIDTNNNLNDFEINKCPSPKTEKSVCLTGDNLTVQDENYENETVVLTSEDLENLDIATTTEKDLVGDVLISEIMADAENDKNAEFVELYNPTDRIIDLAGYSLKRMADFDSTTAKYLANSTAFQGKSILPKKFFLIASEEYKNSTSTLVDVFYTVASSTNRLAEEKDVVQLYKNSNLIDSVKYQKISAGKSLERAALQNNICVSAFGENEFLGNGCDNFGDALFLSVREIPNPQNSASLSEPREKPNSPKNIVIEFLKDESSLKLSWDNAGEVKWEIIQIVGNIYLPKIEANTNNALIKINEEKRSYEFEITAIDKDGLKSDPATIIIDVGETIDEPIF